MSPALDRIERALWNLLLLLVPVSASPLLPLGSGTNVRPLSLVPALALLILALFRMAVLRQRPLWPKDASWLLGLFTVYAVISGLVELTLLPGDPFKGQTPPDSFVRALATLAIGLMFFAVARLHLRSRGDIRQAIFLLLAGLSVSIGFAVFQVYAIVQGGAILRLTQAVTDVFALHRAGLVNRAQGMTFEPSWLATQIFLLMLPPMVARLISRQAFFEGPVSRRNIYLALAGFGVALTGLLCAGSRFGLLSAVLILLLAGFMALRQGRMIAAMAFVVVLLAGGGGIVALGSLSAGAGTNYVLGPVGLILQGPQSAADLSNSDLASSVTDVLSVAGRAASNQAAFDLWRDHPLFGVSLGNTYRYFGRYAPDWSFDTGLFTVGLMEGADWLDSSRPEKANAKNLLLRLLAETGLVGLFLFCAFLARQLFWTRARDNYYAAFRLSTAAALLISFFNLDTFADPAIWILLVLCHAMGRLQAPDERQDKALATTAVHA